MEKLFCYTGDVLGYKNILINLKPEEQRERIQEWHQLIKNGVKSFEIEKCLMVSDTVFAGAEDTSDGLGRLISFSKYLLEEGMKKALPIRGAIDFGEAIWEGNYIYGKAAADSYTLAEKQNWIGTVISNWADESYKEDNPLRILDTLWNINTVVQYPVPLKEKEVIHLPVVSWEIPQLHELLDGTIAGGLQKLGENMTWDYANKIQNTLMFHIYLKSIKGDIIKVDDVSKFPFYSPIWPLDESWFKLFEYFRLTTSGLSFSIENGKWNYHKGPKSKEDD